MTDYYSRTELSNSDLSKFKDLLFGVNKPDPTKAYQFGTLIDMMITEPDKVDYFNYSCDGVIYAKEEFEQAEKMKSAFYKDDFCSNIIKYAEFQKVMVENRIFNYGNFHFNIDVRCKWDMWFTKLKWGADIKSTTATTQAQFEAAVKHFDYDRQRAFYMKIACSEQDMLIGISKKNYKIFKVPIKEGDTLYNSGVEKYSYLAYEYYKRFGNIGNAQLKEAV